MLLIIRYLIKEEKICLYYKYHLYNFSNLELL
jgi:hypothetical protein